VTKLARIMQCSFFYIFFLLIWLDLGTNISLHRVFKGDSCNSVLHLTHLKGWKIVSFNLLVGTIFGMPK
jgi:hypothetical protein